MHLIPQLGTKGKSLFVNNTTAVSDVDFAGIYIIADAVFTSLTGTYTQQGDITMTTFKAGLLLLGNFTAFQLTSGAVWCYQAKE